MIPFLFVQLAAYTAPVADPNNCGEWPKTRADQAKARALPHTYMVTTIDIGDAKRIHPLNKQELGRRFALTLLQDEFKLPKFADSIRFPEVASASVSADKKQIILTLKSPEKLHLTDGNVPRSFAVSGPKQKIRNVMKYQFKTAAAKLDGDRIVVTVPDEVKEPQIIRYGWMMNPQVNVANDLGFPLLPVELEIGK